MYNRVELCKEACNIVNSKYYKCEWVLANQIIAIGMSPKQWSSTIPRVYVSFYQSKRRWYIKQCLDELIRPASRRGQGGAGTNQGWNCKIYNLK